MAEVFLLSYPKRDHQKGDSIGKMSAYPQTSVLQLPLGTRTSIKFQGKKSIGLAFPKSKFLSKSAK